MRPIIQRPQKTGQVYVFGSGLGGELGLGAVQQERRKPGNLKLLNNQEIVQLSCGGQHTLALSRNGQVFSWGINDQGALGRITKDLEEAEEEDYELQGIESWAPTRVSILDDQGLEAEIVQMVCADSFCAVLSSAGDVYAWGSFRDPSGVIGFDKSMQRKSQVLPKKLTQFGRERVVFLGSGENHIFAVTADDTLWAFGANDESQLGRRASSRFRNNLEPYEIKGTGKKYLHDIRKITGGAYHTIYVNGQGELYTFGNNNCGQLGLGDVMSHLNGPERVQFAIAADGKTRIQLPQIVDIAAGESHSLAVSADGRLFAWGANLEGQCGFVSDAPVYGDERDFMLPRSNHSSAANSPEKADYKLKFQPLPREVPRLTEDEQHGLPAHERVISVDAQSRFSVCVTQAGNLYTWGSGHSMQLGNEETEDEPIPFRVELKGRKAFQARCGGQFTMFLLEPKDQLSASHSHVDIKTVADGSGSSQQNNAHGAQNGSAASPTRQAGSQNTQQQRQSTYGNYRLAGEIPLATSLPGSPQLQLPVMQTSSPRADKKNSSQRSSPRGRQSKKSPEKDVELRDVFAQVCVSPERKRPRAAGNSSLLGSPQQFSADEKMAMWSPSRLKSPPRPSNNPVAKKPTVMERMRVIDKNRRAQAPTAQPQQRETRTRRQHIQSQEVEMTDADQQEK